MAADVLTRLRLLLRRAPARPAPRANSAAIAVLEHDLYGTPPAPGSMANLAIGMRLAGTCLRHRPIAAADDADEPTAVCQGCGRSMILGEHGDWVIA